MSAFRVYGNLNLKKTWLLAGLTGTNRSFVVVEPASVNHEFGSVMSTAFVSTRQPVWSAGQESSSVLPEKLAVTFTGLSATVEIMLNVPLAGVHCQRKPLGSGGRFVAVNAPLALEALKIWNESPAHNVPPRFVTTSEPP